MHKFNAQPSASYQPLGPRSEGEVIDERQCQFNTYSAVEGANHPQFHETRKEDVVSISWRSFLLPQIRRLSLNISTETQDYYQNFTIRFPARCNGNRHRHSFPRSRNICYLPQDTQYSTWRSKALGDRNISLAYYYVAGNLSHYRHTGAHDRYRLSYKH